MRSVPGQAAPNAESQKEPGDADAAPGAISEALLEALLDAAVEGIVVTDAEGSIRLFNAGAQRLFGYSQGEMLGRNVHVLMPEPMRSEHDGYMHRYHETGQAKIIGIGREVLAQHQNGESFPIDLSVGEATGPDGAMYVGILRDLRQRARLENQLQAERENVRDLERRLAHVHRTSTLGEMAAGIAHEINQPLAAISTYADAGRRLSADPARNAEKLDHALRQIGVQAQRAGDVVRRVRDMAKQQETPREPWAINEIVADLMDLAKLEARETDAVIHLQLENDLPFVNVDAVQIQQVLLNLIRNGLESMVTRSQMAKGIRIETTRVNEDVRVCVVDHGVGVSSSQAGSIFNPFHTSKPDGVGIGLSICETIVKRHGGALWYESNPDGGSRFLFTLPAFRQADSEDEDE